ncbi:MAG: hypothetical protein CL610_18025 [Anaerolineaceae bacterium]|nr:hypothetical protein [Anaerolineaceae bacterium]
MPVHEHLPASWPLALRHFLAGMLGKSVYLTQLHGKSGAAVWRLGDDEPRSVIIKQADTPNEAHFYRDVAPALRAEGIPVPEAWEMFQQGDTHWLVLEDIPLSLPAHDPTIQARQVTILAHLHSLPRTILPAMFDGFKPGWSPELTDKALACLPADITAQLRPVLEALQNQAQPLFQPQAITSGDPNPTNWGLRSDGTPVLFDWERITQAAPAIDLAIIVAGLGTARQFADIAQLYRTKRDAIQQPYNTRAEQLARQIALAKVWTVIEYLGLYTDGTLPPDATLDYITTHIADWLVSLELA